MSVKVMGLVWDLDNSQIGQNEKYVLLAYADHADHQGGSIFPGISLIAQKTGYSERQIQNITRALQRKGYLVAVGGQKGGRGVSAHWLIPIKGEKIAPFTTIERVQSETKRVKSATRKGEIAIAPESSGTVKEPSPAPAAPIPDQPRKKDAVDFALDFQKPVQTLVSAVAQHFPINVNWNTKTSRQWLQWAHEEGVTPAQIARAAEAWKSDKKFNWAQPTLQKIFENWPALMQASQPAGEMSDADKLALFMRRLTHAE